MVLDNTLIISAIIFLLILIPSIILHEVAHGFIAEKFGDPTARLLGRMTLNPLPHIDPIMSIIFPLVLFILSQGSFVFGAAKPVPVDPFNFRDGRKDIALVSLAGPVTNLLIALFLTVLFHLSNSLLREPLISGILMLAIRLNLLLAIFNLIPIPPLDGSKVFALVLPEKEAKTYLSIGFIGIFILFFLLMNPIGGFSLGSFILNLLTFSEGLLGL